MSRRAATARSGIFGWTIRDASCLPLDGRRNSADPRPSLRGEAVRVQRCELRAAATARAFRALGIFPHFMHCSLVRSQNNRKSSLGIVRSQKNHLYGNVRSQNNTCTQSKQQDVPLCTSSAVGLLKSVEAGQSRQRPFAQERRGDARHLEGCEADERPCQDRDLDPP